MRRLLLGIVALSLTADLSGLAEDSARRTETLQAVERASEFLQNDGRAWYEGEIDIQKEGCVSCHQVPSGLWSLAVADRTLSRSPSDQFLSLLNDANQFVTDPDEDNSPAAAVSQLLLANAAYMRPDTPSSADDLTTLVRLALESQRDDGTWKSAGQFPSQRRPIRESDLVVSMWMIRGLEHSADKGSEISRAVAKARQAIQQSDGVSTEWLAWRILTEPDHSNAMVLGQQLVQRQRGDGSWGFLVDSVGDPYSTGVALFALSERDMKESVSSVRLAVDYLMSCQQDDGSWTFEAGLISKKSSYSRDYVYRYWGTAWATLGLAASLEAPSQSGAE